MSFSSYANNPTAALAGQVVSPTRIVGKYMAGEEIPPGRVVVLNADGELELPQDTTLGKVVGVSMYRSAKEPGNWAAGDYVEVCRKGLIWAGYTGTSFADLDMANVYHSSDTSTHRGKVTEAALSGEAGEEVSPAPLRFYDSGPSGLALLEVDLPCAGGTIYSMSKTVAFGDFTSAVSGAAETIDFDAPMPVGAMVVGAGLTVATLFSGGTVSAITAALGVSGGDVDAIIDEADVFTGAATGLRTNLTNGVKATGCFSEQLLGVTFDPTDDALDNVTAGSLTAEVFFFVG